MISAVNSILFIQKDGLLELFEVDETEERVDGESVLSLVLRHVVHEGLVKSVNIFCLEFDFKLHHNDLLKELNELFVNLSVFKLVLLGVFKLIVVLVKECVLGSLEILVEDNDLKLLKDSV